MFKIPLHKTMKNLKKYSDSRQHEAVVRKNRKLAFVGSKLFVLAATLSLSTVFSWIFFFCFELNPFPIDHVVNVISLLLMSPYYSGPKGNNELLYRNLCKPCILCCCQVQNSLLYHEDKKRRKRESVEPLTTSEKETVDTGSAHRVHVEEKSPRSARGHELTESVTADKNAHLHLEMGNVATNSEALSVGSDEE